MSEIFDPDSRWDNFPCVSSAPEAPHLRRDLRGRIRPRARSPGPRVTPTIARVRRAFHVQGWSFKRIVRELHVSRNAVRKILRSDETDFSDERERQSMPTSGAFSRPEPRDWHYRDSIQL